MKASILSAGLLDIAKESVLENVLENVLECSRI